MESLNLPPYPFKIKSGPQRTQIFDPIRKKYVALTPEEWVRQHFAQYLISEKDVPGSLMAFEMAIKYDRLNKRGDIVVFGKNGSPVLIVECKAASVKIDQKVFDQIARYNMNLKVNYLAVTNGLDHYYCFIDHQQKTYSFLKELPSYSGFQSGNDSISGNTE